jgi:vacuolar-type H+-ATPase subunit D/Vma8
MGILFAKFLSLAFLVNASVALAEIDVDYLTIKSVTVSLVTKDPFNQEKSMELYHHENSRVEAAVASTGKVIAVARELVALGEDIYRLVNKGRPSSVANYAPISVLPKVGGVAVDILDTEGWRMPTKYSYDVSYKNMYGIEVVKFRYSVIFSYGGSFNGKGAYLTAAQIVPETINTLFGFDFNANMKLVGLQNHGTKENPVAGAILSMEYFVGSMVQENRQVTTFHITGRGGFKKL